MKQAALRFCIGRALKREFDRAIGKPLVTVDCFGGLGLQQSDLPLMSLPKQILIQISELLKWLSQYVPALVYLADSVYVQTTRADFPLSRRS